MKKQFSIWSLVFLCLVFGGWVAFQISVHIQELSNFSLRDSRVSGREAVVLLLLVALLMTLVVLNEAVQYLRESTNQTGFVATRLAWLLGLFATTSNSSAVLNSPATSIAAPITGSISPVAAVSVLAHIERRRRAQIKQHTFPDVLTTTELDLLHQVRQARAKSSFGVDPNINVGEPFGSLLRAVDRTLPDSLHGAPVVEVKPWIVEVKVYGYPMVVSVDGVVAEFRKKRALELLTWLSLNRDRPRRSAARTAMWDIDISDSAFATVVSDMRRGLRDLGTQGNAFDWAPITYTDDIQLSPLVTTDADRLQMAFGEFKSSGNCEKRELMTVLRSIRDVPFAGTSYSWADYDGTTTRLVISAIEVCMKVVEAARDQNDGDLLLTATSAGLRVLPGCEELLAVQDLYINEKFGRRSQEVFWSPKSF